MNHRESYHHKSIVSFDGSSVSFVLAFSFAYPLEQSQSSLFQESFQTCESDSRLFCRIPITTTAVGKTDVARNVEKNVVIGETVRWICCVFCVSVTLQKEGEKRGT